MYGVGFGYGAIGATTVLSGGVAIDADAQSFFTASGITDATQMGAVNTLVTELKSNNLWTKMKAIYPIVGGNATAHSKNLKNPSQYNLTFSSGWVHSSTGAKPNGTSAYANTSLNPNGILSINSLHVSSYIRENLSQFPSTLIGVGDTTGVAMIVDGTNSEYITANDNWSTTVGQYITDPRGLITLSRIDSSQKNLYKNSTNVMSINIANNSTLPNYNFYISALNNATNPQYFDNKQCAFATIGDGLTSTQAGQLNTIITTFQTSLSRNV